MSLNYMPSFFPEEVKCVEVNLDLDCAVFYTFLLFSL